MKLSLRGRVRTSENTGGNDHDGNRARVNPRSDLLVAQGLPPLAELARLRRTFFALHTNAVAPVTALPTTAAQVSLYNNSPHNGVALIVEAAFTIIVVSAAAAATIGIVCQMNLGLKTAPSTNLLVPKGTGGQQPSSSAAIVATAQAVTNDGWNPLGTSVVHNSATQLGTAMEVLCRGLYVVYPGNMFSISTIAHTATTITCKAGLRWHEVQLPAP